MIFSSVIVPALLSWQGVAATEDKIQQPTVRLSAGLVRGRFCPGSRAKQFLGIPFAKAPTGPRRFMPPEVFTGLYDDGILDAGKPSASCIQFGTYGNSPNMSEDCLHLNVYVPARADPGSGLPIKVFQHGGGNVVGDMNDKLYNGCTLATDSIVIMHNYRLGPLGFLSLPDAGINGNMAIKDTLLALQWVRKHGALFGGNPDKMVLFGQSSGADNAFVLSSLREAEPLLSGVVLESGGGIDVIPPDIAEYSGKSFAQTLGCKASCLRCLQSATTNDTIKAFQHTPALLQNSDLTNIFGVNLPNTTSLSTAVMDGRFIRQQPLATGSRVPLLAGGTERENTLFMIPYYRSLGTAITEATYTQFLNLWGNFSSQVGHKYPLSRFNDTGSTEDAVILAVTHITTTISYTCQAFKTLRATRASGVPAFAYRFNTTPSCPWSVMDGAPYPSETDRWLFGPAHTAELPFVFADMKNLPFGTGVCNASVQDRAISRRMVAAWTGMAATGSPSTAMYSWPRFEACDAKGVYFQEGAKVSELDYGDCQFWDGIWATWGGFVVPQPSCTK